MGEQDELPQLEELFRRLRNDAVDIMKFLATTQLIFRAASLVMIVNGGVSLAIGIAGMIMTQIAGISFLNLSFPNMLIAIAVGFVLLILGSVLEDKGEDLKKKYGDFRQLKKELGLTKG